jgi:hypothetical protein
MEEEGRETERERERERETNKSVCLAFFNVPHQKKMLSNLSSINVDILNDLFLFSEKRIANWAEKRRTNYMLLLFSGGSSIMFLVFKMKFLHKSTFSKGYIRSHNEVLL